MTNFDFSITYSYLTLERRKFFTLTALSLAYFMLIVPVTRAHLTRLKLKKNVEITRFLLENQHENLHLSKTRAYDQ